MSSGDPTQYHKCLSYKSKQKCPYNQIVNILISFIYHHELLRSNNMFYVLIWHQLIINWNIL